MRTKHTNERPHGIFSGGGYTVKLYYNPMDPFNYVFFLTVSLFTLNTAKKT